MTTIHRIHPTAPMRGQFHLDVCHEDPGEVVIYVVGELDIATTSVLRACLADLFDVGTPWSTLEVDLSAAPFVDVSAAGLLLNAHRRAEERRYAVSHALQRAARPAPAPRPCRGTDRSDPRSR